MAAKDAANILSRPSSMDGLFGHGQSFLHVISGKTAPMPEDKKGQDMGKRDIVLIRHGATKLNSKDISADRIRGWKDVPLSESGRSEAQRVGKQLRHGDKLRPDILIPSDLSRARETSEIISKIAGIPQGEPTQGFRPWNVGKYAGQPTTEAIPILSDYAENKPDQPIPEGESFDDFKGRFFNELHSALQNNEGKVGIVTHHRAERLLKAWVANGHHPDGEIDITEFNKKGEHTGNAEELSLPTKNLQAAAEFHQKQNPHGSGKLSLRNEEGE